MWNGQHYFSGDMVEGYYFKDHNAKPHIRVNEYVDNQFCRTVDLEVKPGTVGQYLGFKCENGEVYSTDIIIYEGKEWFLFCEFGCYWLMRELATHGINESVRLNEDVVYQMRVKVPNVHDR